MALETQKQYIKVVVSTYELLRNLLAGEPQSQWDRIVQEMHEHDSWAGVDGKRHDEKRPKTWTSFQECVELHKLTVFTLDAAKRQKCYIQMTVCKPQRATVREFFSHVETLNGHLKYLPMLKNSPMAVATTNKGNVPFGYTDLALILLAAVPITWQNQYNLTHATVPDSPRQLLADLENIERVMMERKNERQRLKEKAVVAAPGKGKPKRGSSGGGSSIRVPKKARTEKFFQLCKTHGGAHQTHNMSKCWQYDKDGKPLSATRGKLFDKHKPYKKHGGEKELAYMTAMLEAIQKGQKKAAKGKKHKKRSYDSSSDSDSE